MQNWYANIPLSMPIYMANEKWPSEERINNTWPREMKTIQIEMT